MSGDITDPKLSEQEEADIAREMRGALPAIYVDTWVTLTWKDHIRIVLGEHLYRKDQYRAAFIMEIHEAESFALHLLKSVEARRMKDAERLKKNQTQDGDG